MSLRLILMRHAKSDWHAQVSGDLDRPLNTRGHASAAAIGAWLRDKKYFPDLVLCSAAKRTQQTWEHIEREIGNGLAVEFSNALYLASPEAMLEAITDVSGQATILMIAHNPGSAILATALAKEPHSHIDFPTYPTASTAIFEFETEDWAKLQPGTGQVVDFIVPRDLAN